MEECLQKTQSEIKPCFIVGISFTILVAIYSILKITFAVLDR